MDVLNVFLQSITNAISKVVFFNVLSGFGIDALQLPLALAILLFGYIYATIAMRGFQFTKLKYCFKYVFGRNKAKSSNGEKDISSIKTLFTSIAGCTGMNATAGIVFMIAIGGVGTVFWLPFLTFLCMAFRFEEVYLSHHYRDKKQNENLGGPFDYIKKGLAEINLPKLGKVCAFLYAFFMIISGMIGVSMYETNQCVSIITSSFGFLNGKRILMSLIVIGLIFVIIVGGTKRIMNFMGSVLPVLAIIYIIASMIVIIAHYQNLGNALLIIFEDAMHPRAMAGGFVASLCMTARKMALSHETGLGTSGIVHASSTQPDSVREATGAMMTPIINAFCVCMMTVLVVITTGAYKSETAGNDGVVVLFNAFGTVSKVLPYIVTILVPMLVFNVLLGWCNYIIKCSMYCFNNKIVVKFIVSLFLIFAFIGGITDDFVMIMNLVDALMMLIIILNVSVIMLLTKKVYNVVKNYDFKGSK